MPEKRTLSGYLKPYFCISAQFSIANGILQHGKRIIDPPPLRLRKKLLETLHSGHQGITKYREE